MALLTGAFAPTDVLGADMSEAEMITSAESAAPSPITRDATVVAMSHDGKMRVLRQGTNGFTCMPDNPASPGPDPMCGDANAMAWAEAWIGRAPPPEGKVGFMYMLATGSDASNTDPYAQAPASGNHWIETGPHVMVVGAKGMMGGYPRAADPNTAQPYVMWPDTPYEHLMLPVR
ncbi:MAG TPA: hypothetical protein VFY87_08580 [Geminicoccaceae bacterium]|nr:hypothetical protein [Geminicoccaceae bacterium]